MVGRRRRGVALTGFGLSLEEILIFARKAKDAGVDSIWAAEGARDAFTTLAAVTRVAPGTRLATGVATFARPPMMTELAAMTLAELSGGRFLLGLGTAPPSVCEKWQGVPYVRPAARMREYIQCIRAMWSATPGEPISYRGEFFEVTNYGRYLKAPYDHVPIYLAAVRTQMLELVGEVADGWIGNVLNTCRYVREVVRPAIGRGLQKSGRPAGAVELCSYRTCAVNDDRRLARELARKGIAFYCAYPYFDVVLDPAGFAEQRKRIQAAYAKGDLPAMIAAVTDEMIDALALAGTPDEVRDQLSRYEELFDEIVLFPPFFCVSEEQTRENHENLLAVLAD